MTLDYGVILQLGLINMAQQVIDNGDSGLAVRNKINDNFQEVYSELNGGGSNFSLSSTQPSDTTVSWVDTGNAFAGMYPIRRYINGAWEAVTNDGDYFDPIGGVISKGKPLCVLVWGQSNTASSFYLDYLDQTTGDVAKDQRITIWNADSASWTIPDFANQPTGGTSNNWSWNLNLGANNIQTFAKLFVKNSNRAIRIVQWRQGGTPLAYWEPGATGGCPGYTNLTAQAAASAIPYFDLIIGVHGEGGLSDATYISNYSSYKVSLYSGIMASLRAKSYCNSRTAFIMPSHGNGLFVYPIGVVTSSANSAEEAIRSLSSGSNPYNSWAQGPHYKAIQKPLTGPGSTTSTTSVNLSTVTAPVSITVASGLGTSIYSSSNPIVVISRGNPNEYFVGSVSSYNNTNGAMVITTNPQGGTLQVFGTGTHTDWDVLPQDYLHMTVHDNILNGQAIFRSYLNIIYSLAKPNIIIQDIDAATFNVNRQKIDHAPSDDTQEYYQTSSLNSGTQLTRNFIAGAATPTLKEFYKSSGTATEVEYYLCAKSGSEATITDLILKAGYWGLLLGAVQFFLKKVGGSGAFDTYFKLGASGEFQLQAGSSGSNNAKYIFRLGNTSAIEVFEKGTGGSPNQAVYKITGGLENYASNAAAIAGGLTTGCLYQNSGTVMVVI